MLLCVTQSASSSCIPHFPQYAPSLFLFSIFAPVESTEISSNSLPPQTCPFKDLFGNFFWDKYPETEPLCHRIYKQVLSLLSTMPAQMTLPPTAHHSCPHTSWRYPAFWYLPFSLVWHDISLSFEHFSTGFLIFCVFPLLLFYNLSATSFAHVCWEF